MEKRSKRMVVVLFVATLFATGSVVGTGLAQKQSVPKPPPEGTGTPVTRQGLTDAQVKQLLLLMDTDKNGKIAKQEWMNFMSAEFDRLDTDKSGELDPKELAGSKVQRSTFPQAAGK